MPSSDPVRLALESHTIERLGTLGQRYRALEGDPSNFAARQRQAIIRQAIHVARQIEP